MTALIEQEERPPAAQPVRNMVKGDYDWLPLPWNSIRCSEAYNFDVLSEV
jgi:hypothetical protein